MLVLALSIAFQLGVFFASQTELSSLTIAIVAVLVVLLGVTAIRYRSALRIFFVTMMFVFGLVRIVAFDSEPPTDLLQYYGVESLEVEGVVSSDPEPLETLMRLRIEVERVKRDETWTDASGTALVTLRESLGIVQSRDRPYFRYGDRLRLRGELEPPAVLEDFDYPAYLARQGITTVMSFPSSSLLNDGGGSAFYRNLYRFRNAMAVSIVRIVPEPQASLGQALLLGIRGNVPDDVVEQFRVTGAAHVLAISGLHVGILLLVSLKVSEWALGRRRQLYLIVPLLVMWGYALVSGASPSVIRAAIMGSVFLAAHFFGRPRSILPSLGLAAAVMVALDPEVMLSVSFQLSFSAMAGIAVLFPPINALLKSPASGRLERGSFSRILLDAIAGAVAVTIAATLATLPIVLFYFGRVSVLGVPTSVLVLPAMPVVIGAHLVGAFIGIWSDWIAQPFGWLAWATTRYMTEVVGLMSRMPGAALETGTIHQAVVWLYYVVLVTIVWALGRVERLRAIVDDPLRSFGRSGSASRVKSVPLWLLAIGVTSAAIIWAAALDQSDGVLQVAFVDVGQGDAIFVTTPRGNQILIDGGPTPSKITRHIGENMSFLDRTIELAVLTHPNADHIAGLSEVMRRYDVKRVLEREVEHDSPVYLDWRKAVESEGAEVTQAVPDVMITFGDGVYLHVIGPPVELLRGTKSDADNASVVARLVYGDVSILLTGDAFEEAESELIERGAYLDSDVLKVGHHGSRTSSSEAFIDAISPSVAIISAKEGHRFGHPHEEALGSLRRHVSNDRLFLTSTHGTIEIVTDGKTLSVVTER